MTDQPEPSAPDEPQPVRQLLDFGLAPSFANDSSPDAAVAWVAGHLRAAASGDEPVMTTVTAIRSFLSALVRGDLHRASPDLLENLSEAVEPVGHRLMLEAPKGVHTEVIALGIGSLGFLVGVLRKPVSRKKLMRPEKHLLERHELLALLADELDAFERRRRLDMSGNQLSRSTAHRVVMHRADAIGNARH